MSTRATITVTSLWALTALACAKGATLDGAGATFDAGSTPEDASVADDASDDGDASATVDSGADASAGEDAKVGDDASDAPATSDASDPCATLACDAPPASSCVDATHLRTYATPGTCSGGTCSYVPTDVPCNFGCTSGVCDGDPCIGKTCASPPPSYCSAATTRVVYDVPGACAAGTCSYASKHDEVCQYGCVNGACRACAVDGDCGSGRRCDAGACVACDTDTHCGATCADCTAQATVCNAAKTACAQCAVDAQCGAGSRCNAGTCVACDTVDHCGASCARCGALQACTTGACVDVGCPPPAVSCTTGNESRDRCSGARVIGRTVAASATGYKISSDTCSASNRFDVCSWDAGADHAYRLYMRGGETTNITLAKGAGCVNSSWDATLHVFSNSGCADMTCPTEEFCADFFTGTRAYTAPRDGWYVIVVDGSTAFDDEGAYTLTVKLACKTAGCECP